MDTSSGSDSDSSGDSEGTIPICKRQRPGSPGGGRAYPSQFSCDRIACDTGATSVAKYPLLHGPLSPVEKYPPVCFPPGGGGPVLLTFPIPIIRLDIEVLLCVYELDKVVLLVQCRVIGISRIQGSMLHTVSCRTLSLLPRISIILTVASWCSCQFPTFSRVCRPFVHEKVRKSANQRRTGNYE